MQLFCSTQRWVQKHLGVLGVYIFPQFYNFFVSCPMGQYCMYQFIIAIIKCSKEFHHHCFFFFFVITLIFVLKFVLSSIRCFCPRGYSLNQGLFLRRWCWEVALLRDGAKHVMALSFKRIHWVPVSLYDLIHSWWDVSIHEHLWHDGTQLRRGPTNKWPALVPCPSTFEVMIE